MSLLINGLDMPKNCAGCDLSIYHDGYIGGYGYKPCGWWCRRLKRLIKEGESKPTDCPIAEIPIHHGRLIDADRLIRRLNGIEYIANAEGGRPTFSEVLEEIAKAPTIIEKENARGWFD